MAGDATVVDDGFYLGAVVNGFGAGEGEQEQRKGEYSFWDSHAMTS